MKTTIEVLDALFASAKSLAQQRKTTMRALVEEGLRRVLRDSPGQIKPAFKLNNASIPGGKVLISDPRRWREMEEDHVALRAIKPAQ